MKYAVKTVTIAAAAAVSDAVDLEGYILCAIEMPAAWTAANLTFRGASNGAAGATYQDVYGDDGAEVVVTAAASRVIGIDDAAGKLAALRFLRLRSGTAATPVNQAAERKINLILKSS